jgi:lipoprotein-anchoring transpeptidase ErfK/SrfK
MQHLVLPAILTLFTVTAASAGPLNLTPDVSRGTATAPRSGQPTFGRIFAEAPAEPAPVRQAAANGPAYGGGFIEMLFGGPGNRNAAPRYEQNPAYAPSSEAVHAAVDPRYQKQEVNYDGTEKPGTIVINTNEKLLYLVTDGGKAIRYGIGVGRPGFTWSGVHHISQKREWPDWTPPPEMLKRRPDLPRHMQGGPDNPLGARAMYLGSSLYRIHGSNEPWTIGTSVSSGCIRMRNEDVVDLYAKVRVGAKVVVI